MLAVGPGAVLTLPRERERDGVGVPVVRRAGPRREARDEEVRVVDRDVGARW